MKVTSVLVAVFAASANADALLRRATCNADNCARSVTGTAIIRPTQSSRRADCSSFFLTTIIPPTITPTVTTASTSVSVTTSTSGLTTSTVTVVYVSAPSKRAANPAELEGRTITVAESPTTVTASNVPAYASPCSGTARYSSACSCWGVLPATITANAPIAPAVTSYTTTITQVVTETTVVPTVIATHTACAPQNNYDYIYALTNGQGALVANSLGSLSAYDCCSACYAPDVAGCAGTVFEGGQCTLYTLNGSEGTTDTCPGGFGSVEDRPGSVVQLGPCGFARPVPTAV